MTGQTVVKAQAREVYRAETAPLARVPTAQAPLSPTTSHAARGSPEQNTPKMNSGRGLAQARDPRSSTRSIPVPCVAASQARSARRSRGGNREKPRSNLDFALRGAPVPINPPFQTCTDSLHPGGCRPAMMTNGDMSKRRTKTAEC